MYSTWKKNADVAISKGAKHLLSWVFLAPAVLGYSNVYVTAVSTSPISHRRLI